VSGKAQLCLTPSVAHHPSFVIYCPTGSIDGHNSDERKERRGTERYVASILSALRVINDKDRFDLPRLIGACLEQWHFGRRLVTRSNWPR